MGFSVNFDPTQLQYVSAQVGFGASGAFLIENDSNKANGQIGFGLAAPQPVGSLFPAGTLTILQLTFTAIGSQGTTTPVTFRDIPTVRQVADPNALSLPSSFVDGAVTIPGRRVCSQPSRRRRHLQYRAVGVHQHDDQSGPAFAPVILRTAPLPAKPLVPSMPPR